MKIHDVYLPFTEEQLAAHFVPEMSLKGHLDAFRKSMANLRNARIPDRKGMPLHLLKLPYQHEKDERFWTASTMMTVFYSENCDDILCQLMRLAYGEVPPVKNASDWKDCFAGELKLYFEANLPSPKKYRQWLRANLRDRQFIPHILDSAEGIAKNLEGPTNVDAVLLNVTNGFTLLVEAKVLSDISCQVTYDQEFPQKI